MTHQWPTKRLGDVAEVSAGNPAPQDESFFKHGGFPFFRTADAGRVRFGEIYESTDHLNNEGMKRLRRYPKGTILFPKSGASTFLNHRVMLGVEGCVSSHLATIVADERQVDAKFVLFFLSTIAAQDLVQDHAYPSLNLPTITKIRIPLPPLAEQRRIAYILDEAFKRSDGAKVNAQKNLENARVLFESYLQSVFTERGKGWATTTLERVLSLQPQNGWSPPAENHAGSGTPVLTLSSVTGFHFRADKKKFTSARTEPQRSYWVNNGDLLITRSNTTELVGHVAIASGITEPTIYPDLIMRMRPTPERANTEFLYYQLRSPHLRQEISRRAQGASPTMKKLSNGAVRNLSVSIPSIQVQRETVEGLNAVAAETQRLESVYHRKVAALDELKKSLLHQAFTGKL